MQFLSVSFVSCSFIDFYPSSAPCRAIIYFFWTRENSFLASSLVKHGKAFLLILPGFYNCNNKKKTLHRDLNKRFFLDLPLLYTSMCGRWSYISNIFEVFFHPFFFSCLLVTPDFLGESHCRETLLEHFPMQFSIYFSPRTGLTLNWFHRV